MKALTKSIDITLGPDTFDFVMCCSLYSEQIIVPEVFRGQKSIFQLSFETVNTTTYMKSMGICNSIHIPLINSMSKLFPFKGNLLYTTSINEVAA